MYSAWAFLIGVGQDGRGDDANAFRQWCSMRDCGVARGHSKGHTRCVGTNFLAEGLIYKKNSLAMGLRERKECLPRSAVPKNRSTTLFPTSMAT
jgi:hypothetical protein